MLSFEFEVGTLASTMEPKRLLSPSARENPD